MVEEKSIVKRSKHGIDMPDWMWSMIDDARKLHMMTCRSAWIWDAIIEKAKRDKVYAEYNEALKKTVGGRHI